MQFVFSRSCNPLCTYSQISLNILNAQTPFFYHYLYRKKNYDVIFPTNKIEELFTFTASVSVESFRQKNSEIFSQMTIIGHK